MYTVWDPELAPALVPDWPGQIRVTQDDIDNGVPGDPAECAIARAAKRIMPWADQILVTHGEITIWLAGQCWTMKLPSYKFVSEFDDQGAVRPTTFVVQSIRSGESRVELTVLSSEMIQKQYAAMKVVLAELARCPLYGPVPSTLCAT